MHFYKRFLQILVKFFHHNFVLVNFAFDLILLFLYFTQVSKITVSLIDICFLTEKLKKKHSTGSDFYYK